MSGVEEILYKIFFFIINIDVLMGIAILFVVFFRNSEFRLLKKLREKLSYFVFLVLLLVVIFPAGSFFMWNLENQYPTPQKNKIEEAHGLILLGGFVDAAVWRSRGTESFNPAAGRLISFVKLMREYPDKKYVFTGRGRDFKDGLGEAEMAQDLFPVFGINSDKITYEDQSKNTEENATFTANLLQEDKNKKWVLVTSAFHLKRSMMLFEAAGFTDLVPYPVDYHTKKEFSFWPNPSLILSFANWHVSIKEVAGILREKIKKIFTDS